MKEIKDPVGKTVWVKPKSEYGPQIPFPCVIVEVSEDPGEADFPVYLRPKSEKNTMVMVNFPWRDLQTTPPTAAGKTKKGAPGGK